MWFVKFCIPDIVLLRIIIIIDDNSLILNIEFCLSCHTYDNNNNNNNNNNIDVVIIIN